MLYINPFSLLAIEPGSLFDTPKSIRDAKRKVLADIELDDNVVVNGVTVLRADALRVIGELDSEALRRTHSLIFYDDSFHQFLTQGNDRWLYQEHDGESYESLDLGYLEPFYTGQISKVVSAAISGGSIFAVKRLARLPIPFRPEWFKNSYRPAIIFFEQKLERIKDITEEVESDASLESIISSWTPWSEQSEYFNNPFCPFDRAEQLDQFLNRLIDDDEIKLLNSLPREFQLQRDNIATGLRNLMLFISNKLDEDRLAVEIVRHGSKIASSPRLADLYKDDEKSLRPYAVNEALSILKEQLDELQKSIWRGSVGSPSEAVKIVFRIFDIESINSVSTTKTNTSIINLANQLCEISRQLVSSYSATDDALAIISRGLQLRLSDDDVSAALLQKLIYKFGEIEQSRVIRQPEPKADNRPSDATRNRKVSSSSPVSPTASNFDFVIDQPGLISSIWQKFIGDGSNIVLRFLALFFVAFVVPIIIYNVSRGSVGRSNETASAGSMNSSNKLPNTNGQVNRTIFPAASPNSTVKPTPSPSPTPLVKRLNSGAIVGRGSTRSGRGYLDIINGSANDALVRLVESSSNRMYREIYVRGNSSARIIGITPGSYELMFTTGSDFAPSLKKFLNSAQYEKFDNLLEFSESWTANGVEFSSHKVTLNRVLNGNAPSTRIDESSFDH